MVSDVSLGPLSSSHLAELDSGRRDHPAGMCAATLRIL